MEQPGRGPGLGWPRECEGLSLERGGGAGPEEDPGCGAADGLLMREETEAQRRGSLPGWAGVLAECGSAPRGVSGGPALAVAAEALAITGPNSGHLSNLPGLLQRVRVAMGLLFTASQLSLRGASPERTGAPEGSRAGRLPAPSWPVTPKPSRHWLGGLAVCLPAEPTDLC